MAEFVYLTPDEYRALRERIDRAESSTTHWKSETLRLRARLAEVEANNDMLAEAWRKAQGETDVALHDGDLLRARLAEVEVELSEERDHAEEGWERARHLQGLLQAAERGESKQIRRAEAAEARLARVEALCDQWDDLPNHVRRDIDAFDVICEVRAAAEGDDRG